MAEWSQGQPLPKEGEDTIVRQIRDYIYANVLRTETLVRLVAATVADFNRLVTKLEANAANPDFWEATSSAT
jgi:hypothetical protein